MIAAAQLALAAGAGVGSTFLPGPCSLAVIAVTHRHGSARGTALGAGVALGDATYATLGTLGLGRGIASEAGVAIALRVASAAVAIACVIVLLRLRRGPPPARPDGSPGLVRAGVAGYVLLLASPAALLTWTSLAVALPADSTVGDALRVACIASGSFAGYALIARVWSRA